MTKIWQKAIDVYKSGWWKTKANKKGQLEYMFVEGVMYAQRWISVKDGFPDVTDVGISENVLLKLSVYGKKQKNTYECCIEAFYDRDVAEWFFMLPID